MGKRQPHYETELAFLLHTRPMCDSLHISAQGLRHGRVRESETGNLTTKLETGKHLSRVVGGKGCEWLFMNE
jgi:hypothetical protein